MPTLYYFNPGHETAILKESPYYMAPSNVVKMQEDLAYLPAWLGTSGDFALLNSALPQNFVEKINAISVSKGITPNLLENISSELYVQPWGISPQVLHYLGEIGSQNNINLHIPQWNPRLKELTSRKTAHKCLSYLTQDIAEISPKLIPQFCTELNEAEQIVEACNYQLLAKAPFSSSGRGLLWLPVGELTRTERQILKGMLNKQECFSIEKALNKILDFAMEFTLSNDNNLQFEGYSLFETNSKGSYSGNYLGSQQKIIDKISSFVSLEILDKVKKSMSDFFEYEFKDVYAGTIGVDMMIYQEGENYYLHPCLEINVRHNMGILSMKIYENHLHPDSNGSFHIDFNSKEGELLNIEAKLKAKYPLKVTNRKIESGYLSLCPITQQTKYRAYILVEN